MRNVIKFIFCAFSFIFHLQAQVVGLISDSNQKAISNVIIKLKKDNKIIAYTSSNKNGYYVINIKEIGSYELVFSSLNYEEVIIPVTIDDLNQIVEQNVTLYSKEVIELSEVIAIAKRPITVKKDTIIFDADAFLQGNEQVIEDLLKKLPGITVDSEGTIKVGEKEVEKVMIENDDFFEKGYKIITKNMPVQPVDKVELLQSYSDNKHLKGIENSDKVALNLTLKEDAKNQWFGTLEGGLDISSAKFYKITGNLMNFGKKNKYYFLADMNNIGRDASGDLNHLINPTSRAKVFVGDGFKTFKNIEKNPMNLGFEKDRTRINNAELLSLNAIFNPTQKLKIKPILFFNADELNFERNSIRSYELPQNDNFTNTEQYRLRNKSKNLYGKVDLIYDINKTSTLEFSTKFNDIEGNDNTNILFNNRNTNDNLVSNSSRFDQELQYTKKLDEKKVLVLQGRFIYDEINQNYHVNQNYFTDLIDNNTTNEVEQNTINKGRLFGLKVNYLDRKENGNLFELSVENKLEIHDLKNLLFVTNNPYKNNIDYKENQLFINAGYLYKWSEKLNIKLNIIGQNFNLDYDNNQSTSVNNYTALNPKISVEFKPNKRHKIIANYTANNNAANIGFINSEYVLNNFNNLSLGLDKPTILNRNSLFFNYIYGKWTDKLLWNTFMFYNKENDYITSNNSVYQDFTINKYFTVEDRSTFTINSTIDYYVKKLQSNIKIKGSYLRTNYANRINNSDLRKIKSANFSYGLEYRSGFDGFFNFHFGTKNIHYSINVEELKNDYINNSSFIDTYFSFSKKFDIQCNLDYYYFGNLERTNSYYFFDFIGRYKLKKNKIAITLKGKNLFNTNTFRINSITDISESITSFRLLPRYILAGIEYRF